MRGFCVGRGLLGYQFALQDIAVNDCYFGFRQSLILPSLEYDSIRFAFPGSRLFLLVFSCVYTTISSHRHPAQRESSLFQTTRDTETLGFMGILCCRPLIWMKWRVIVHGLKTTTLAQSVLRHALH